MKRPLITLLLSLLAMAIAPASGFAQATDDPFFKELKTGESVVLAIFISGSADQINIYRKTGAGTSSTLVGTLPVLPDVWAYEWVFTMPGGTGGTTSPYRLYIVPKRGSELLGGSNDVRVKRKL